MNEIIIIGTAHHNTLGLIRALGESVGPLTLVLYGVESNFLKKSKYLKDVVYCVSIDDVLDTLKRLVKIYDKKPVIISASDDTASLLDLNYDFFESYAYFFNCGRTGLLTKAMNKGYQVQIAQENGLDVPQSKVFDGFSPHEWNLFPCILKPIESINGGKNIHICSTIDELLHAIKCYENKEKIIIQEFLQKEAEIVLLGVSYGGMGVIPGYIHKKRQHMTGGTTYSTVYPLNNKLIPICEAVLRMVRSIHYNGLFSVELIEYRNKFYFIELNLRNDATQYSMVCAGVNLPLLYYKSVINNLPPVYVTSIKSIDSIVEFDDFGFVLMKKITLFKWLQQRNSAKCKHYYNRRDLGPYISKLFSYLGWFLNTSVKSIFKKIGSYEK